MNDWVSEPSHQTTTFSFSHGLAVKLTVLADSPGGSANAITQEKATITLNDFSLCRRTVFFIRWALRGHIGSNRFDELARPRHSDPLGPINRGLKPDLPALTGT